MDLKLKLMPVGQISEIRYKIILEKEFDYSRVPGLIPTTHCHLKSDRRSSIDKLLGNLCIH